jgi:hypothetical protein
VRTVYREALAAQGRQILDALAADPSTAQWPELAEDPGPTREQVRGLCARAPLGAITS